MEACGILSLVGDDVEVAAPPEGGVDTGPIRSMDLGGAPIHQDGVPAAAPAAPSAPIADGRIEELLVSGQKSDDAGRPQEAIEIWSRIFALDQTNVEAGVRIDRVKAVIEEQSRQVDDLYYRAVDANEANRLEEALGLFQKVLAISPLHPEARSFIEEINLRLGGLGESICVDPGAAREAAEEKKRHIAADADERSVEGIASVPLAHVGPDSPYPPRVPAESSRPTTAAMAEPAAAGPRPGGGGRRLVMAAAGALVVAVVGVGAWLWMGGDTGSMPEARATVPVPASRPMRAGPSAKASPADADRQRGSAAPLRVVPGAAAPPEPEPKPRTVDPEELSKQSALLIREGRQFYQQKRWAEAVLAFRKALMADPVGFDAQDTLDKAMAELEKQARIERDMALAGKAFSEKDYAAALQKFYRIQQDHPEMKILDTYIRNSWFDWGVVLMQEGAPDEAAEKFSEVLDITSNDREASRARDFAKRYHGRQRDAVYDTFASALVMRSLDQP
jgi:tetratricopeptide (TPR) repeat protein